MFLLNILCISWSLGKCFDSSCRNVFPILVLTFFEYGGLNHIMFRFLLRFWFSSLFFGAGITNFNISLKLLSCNASLQILIDLLNTSVFDEVSDKPFSIDFGSCFNIFSGWLECLLIYSGLLPGLRYGLQMLFT